MSKYRNFNILAFIYNRKLFYFNDWLYILFLILFVYSYFFVFFLLFLFSIFCLPHIFLIFSKSVAGCCHPCYHQTLCKYSCNVARVNGILQPVNSFSEANTQQKKNKENDWRRCFFLFSRKFKRILCNFYLIKRTKTKEK